MELLMTEYYMYLLAIKSSFSLTDQNNNRKMYLIRLNLLTKTTWKLKTPGGCKPPASTSQNLLGLSYQV